MSARAWRRTLGCGALCLIAPGAGAVSLGEIEVRSALGEPLEARIPVVAAKDEPLRGACFSLLPQAGAAAPSAPRLELRRNAHGAHLQVRTPEAVSEPALAFAIAIACPGSPAVAPVQYSLRLSRHPVPAARPGTPPLPAVTSLAARSGDSLASLARAIFPRGDAVRARYLAAMRAGNPRLAALGDEDALPEGAAVALPDLHAFAATIPASGPTIAAKRTGPPPAMTATAAAPVPHEAAVAMRAPAAPQRASVRPAAARTVSPNADSAAAAPAAPTRPELPARGAEGFQLRLSAPVIDLTPTRGMDERRRAQLREQLLVLEADDRMAAMLAMREDIRRLESQVSELKLKLATMTSAAPPAAPIPAPTPKVEPAPTPKLEPAPTPRVEPPSQARPAPVEAPPASRAAVPKTDAPPGPRVIPRPPQAEPWYSGAGWLVVVLAFLAAWLALRMLRRGGDEAAEPEYGGDETVTYDEAQEPVDADVATEPPEYAPPVEEAPVATRVPAEDNAELRRRYIEERFPEIVNGALVLEDPGSVVDAACLLYEDGAAARAIELLQFAIEQDPDQMRPWLALFEIFRLEGLPGEFAELSRRFGERHASSDEWRKVRSVGRSLDPGNALYEGAEFGAPFDPAAEGWLRSPADASRRALAAELRGRLMADASVAEDDLRPDPTPALRKSESFTVA